MALWVEYQEGVATLDEDDTDFLSKDSTIAGDYMNYELLSSTYGKIEVTDGDDTYLVGSENQMGLTGLWIFSKFTYEMAIEAYNT